MGDGQPSAGRARPSIEELLLNACPSIRSRVRREILGEPRSAPEVSALQAGILDDGAVKAVLASQHPDGWISRTFHGYDSMESGIRLLCEKDVDPANPSFARALEALRTVPERLERGLAKVGPLLDSGGLGGSLTMRAALPATAGLEESSWVQDEIPGALAAFGAVLTREAAEDFVESYKGKLVYRPGVVWPSIYHLRLLAFTRGWRSAESRRTVAESVRRLVEWSPLPSAYLRNGSQLVAPASFAMHDFDPDMAALDDAGWMIWFHQTELLARLGVMPLIPRLRARVASLEGLLEDGRGWFTKEVSHDYFRRWGAYSGLMLEKDWRQPRRREYDLTFRSLLILHYSGRPAAG